jgi:hypothetical protein
MFDREADQLRRADEDARKEQPAPIKEWEVVMGYVTHDKFTTTVYARSKSEAREVGRFLFNKKFTEKCEWTTVDSVKEVPQK